MVGDQAAWASESKAASDLTERQFDGYSGQEVYVVWKDEAGADTPAAKERVDGPDGPARAQHQVKKQDAANGVAGVVEVWIRVAERHRQHPGDDDGEARLQADQHQECATQKNKHRGEYEGIAFLPRAQRARRALAFAA